jgi:hypothetical protein
MSWQGGRVELKQSNMCLALNMLKIAKARFLLPDKKETQDGTKQSSAELQEEKKTGVEFPWNGIVKAAIKRHLAITSSKQQSRILSLPK